MTKPRNRKPNREEMISNKINTKWIGRCNLIPMGCLLFMAILVLCVSLKRWFLRMEGTPEI